MEETSRAALVAVVAPLAWGSTYYVTETFLPPGRPLFDAVVRALPVGLAILAWRRELPRGGWWLRAALLGVLNTGAFFALIFLAGWPPP